MHSDQVFLGRPRLPGHVLRHLCWLLSEAKFIQVFKNKVYKGFTHQ